MNRILIFRYYVSSSVPGFYYGVNIYYYYAGGTIGYEFDGDPTGSTYTLAQIQALDYFPVANFVNTYSTTSVCVTGFVRKFKLNPYFGSVPSVTSTDTSQACGQACDIAITSWSTTDATTADAEDGTLTIVASTTHGPLEYRLDNGPSSAYQSSNVFTGLDGDKIYFARVRDAAGCLATQAIRVAVASQLYGEKYRIEYFDDFDQATRISIFRRGYTGPVIEKYGTDPALTIEWLSQGDHRFKGIKASEATLGTFSETSFELLGLYSSDDRLHRIDVQKGVDFDTLALFWRGYILPDLYQEPYLDAIYAVTIKATDGLADLKGYTFLTPAKTVIEGEMTEMQLVRFCLDKLNVSLPIYCGINIFETTMASGDDDDPLVQAIVNSLAFYDEDLKPVDLYALLESILLPYGARIYQSFGAWHIENVAELPFSFRRRKFDVDGSFLLSEVHNPLKAITIPEADSRLCWVEGSQLLEPLPANQINTLLQDYGKRSNILPDGEFAADDFVSNTQLKKWSGTASISRVALTPIVDPKIFYGIPPKSTSGKIISQAIAKSKEAVPGVELVGSHMEVDAFGRALLFAWRNATFSYNAFWNTLTSLIETVLLPTYDGTLPLDSTLVGTYASYQLCESETVTRFKFVSVTPVSAVVRETSSDPCPIIQGDNGYMDSTPVKLASNSTETLHISLDYLLAPADNDRQVNENDSADIAKLFLIKFSIRVGDYYLTQGGSWVLSPLSEKTLTIQPEKLNEYSTYETTSQAIPFTGELKVRIHQLVFKGSRFYRGDQSIRLRLKDFLINILVSKQEPDDSLLLSTQSNPLYNQVPEQLALSLGDLPDYTNVAVIYKNGLLINRPNPVGMAYTGWRGDDSNTKTVLLGTGSNADTQLFLTGNQAYFVADGDTLDDKQGPFAIVGTITATGDLVVTRSFLPFPDGFGVHPGRVYRAEEFEVITRPTRLWQRHGPTAADPEPQQQLLRIFLQNVYKQYAAPAQQLSGVLQGLMGFGTVLTDVFNPGKAFFCIGATLSDRTQQWSGQWVDPPIKDSSNVVVNPPDDIHEFPQLHGQRQWQDGDDALWQDNTDSYFQDQPIVT